VEWLDQQGCLPLNAAEAVPHRETGRVADDAPIPVESKSTMQRDVADAGQGARAGDVPRSVVPPLALLAAISSSDSRQFILSQRADQVTNVLARRKSHS
jgi:hypothetical protein